MMFNKKTMIAGNTCSFVKSRLVRMYGVALLCAGTYGGVSYAVSSLTYELPPIPDLPAPLAEDSVPMADAGSFEEVKLDLPVTPGPFEPTWKSIEENYPGTPDWLRDAKFGIWVHFGPQSAGQSGDWYARRLYAPGWASDNHRKNYGDPTRIGYKDVLREWNPDKLDPRKLVEIYKDAGARYLIIQGVHHDQFDMWDSKYQPWNSTRLGPKRDLLGEWTKACRAEGMRFGITFHHEYSWWWWQTAFGHDADGNPYDGNLTLADGVGTWWEGLDPRYLYGVNLREYKGVTAAAYSGWSPPPAGIFQNHLDFSEWYAKWWALRMMDAVDKYQPDFIYTDGTDQQPFSGFGTGTGYKCDAMQRCDRRLLQQDPGAARQGGCVQHRQVPPQDQWNRQHAGRRNSRGHQDGSGLDRGNAGRGLVLRSRFYLQLRCGHSLPPRRGFARRQRRLVRIAAARRIPRRRKFENAQGDR